MDNNSNPAEVQAISKDGITYVPLASIVRQLGGNIDWDNNAKRATMTVRGRNAVVDLNDQVVQVDGQNRSLTATPVVEEGRLYVTPDFLDQIGLSHS